VIIGVGTGMGAMTVAMLRLPMVSVLLPSLLLANDAPTLMPMIIVAHIATAQLPPQPATATPAAGAG
jgi:hypothetical protein